MGSWQPRACSLDGCGSPWMAGLLQTAAWGPLSRTSAGSPDGSRGLCRTEQSVPVESADAGPASCAHRTPTLAPWPPHRPLHLRSDTFTLKTPQTGAHLHPYLYLVVWPVPKSRQESDALLHSECTRKPQTFLTPALGQGPHDSVFIALVSTGSRLSHASVDPCSPTLRCLSNLKEWGQLQRHHRGHFICLLVRLAVQHGCR